MKVLLVGSGGREHALAWKISQSPLLTELVIAPGNPGMEDLGRLRAVDAVDIEAIVALAASMQADLVVVGPEAPLELGLADRLRAAGIPVFGPSRAAAQLETSKAYARDLASRHGVPGAAFGVFVDAEAAGAFLDTLPAPYVVKADGLAAGKGVVIAEDRASADAAISDMLGGRFGKAGARVVIEEFLSGEEASLFALSDGSVAMPFGGAQDHKRAFDNDTGPNTGGMGTYAPAPVLDHAAAARAMKEIVDPTVEAMAAEGAPYIGVLYAGLMIHDGAPRLVEFNARFGDPECQVLMLRLESDLLPYLHASATGGLAGLPLPVWRDDAAICVVLAADGYPSTPQTGTIISGADHDFGPDVMIFHAGTARNSAGELIASGGRVLNVCARGADLREARQRAYAAVHAIDWPEGFYRRDIGWRALASE